MLVVDDEHVRRTLVRLLERQEYTCEAAGDAPEARAILRRATVDVMLCDVTMPGESGLDLIRHVLGTYPDVAVVMVTGNDEPAFAQLALEAGAYGYVIKPFTPNEILINVAGALIRRRVEADARAQRERLVETIRQRTEELWGSIRQLDHADVKLRSSVEEMMQRLSMAAELRDVDTAGHIERVSAYSEILARRHGADAETSSQIELAGRLHDAGKIAMPDRVLRKRGIYTDADREIMRTHAEAGYQLFAHSDAAVLQLAASIAHTHHERWDGTGYPRGLAHEDIPLEGRVVAIADAFDALTSKRPYKPAVPFGAVVEEMRAGAGGHFDPALVATFLESFDEVLEVTQAKMDDR